MAYSLATFQRHTVVDSFLAHCEKTFFTETALYKRPYAKVSILNRIPWFNFPILISILEGGGRLGEMDHLLNMPKHSRHQCTAMRKTKDFSARCSLCLFSVSSHWPFKANFVSFFSSDSIFQIISVSKETGLGLQIVGGIDKNEGPLVYILAVIPGGDCHKVQKAKEAFSFSAFLCDPRRTRVPLICVCLSLRTLSELRWLSNLKEQQIYC